MIDSRTCKSYILCIFRTHYWTMSCYSIINISHVTIQYIDLSLTFIFNRSFSLEEFVKWDTISPSLKSSLLNSVFWWFWGQGWWNNIQNRIRRFTVWGRRAWSTMSGTVLLQYFESRDHKNIFHLPRISKKLYSVTLDIYLILN